MASVTDKITNMSAKMDDVTAIGSRHRKLFFAAFALIGAIVIVLQIATLARQGGGYCHVADDKTQGKEPILLPGTRTTTERIQPLPEIAVTKTEFGRTAAGTNVQKYTLSNRLGTSVDLITYGAIISAIRVRDKHARLADIALGYDTLADYESRNVPYFGALVGRVANRITLGRFSVDGVTYNLSTNLGRNHLHGGVNGWNRAVWAAEEIEGGVRMSHVSPDGDEGYPGEVRINATYRLTDDDQLVLRMTAVNVGKATPLNPTSHSYFNLAGEGAANLNDHHITIFADHYLPTTLELIPTGEKLAVNGTLYDLRRPTALAESIARFNGSGSMATEGFDNTFCLRGPEGKRLAARVHHVTSGRAMEVYTNQPGVQFYTSNTLNVTGGGKAGHRYSRHSAFCLETQNYPDAINKPTFPDSVLREGSTYDHEVWFRFYTQP